jgi:Asp-tRNA(Asn)/Glu-tRNA(Gln) amidotransferase A subunit family amidase
LPSRTSSTAADAPALFADAVALRDRIARGEVRAGEAAAAANARIAERDPEIRAFAWHDPAWVASQADAMDAHRGTGRPLGALHGVPVAVKDIVDTARIPTENGCAADAGRVPSSDAAAVERLKAAGAVIAGKAATAELALYHPAPTRNPVAPGRTPGGSSSGSAAAVADGMVPLAVGTQTAGSVIRPASFCGVVGFKPTFGLISRRGILAQAPSLDTVGVFARTVAGAALLADALAGHDPADPATSPAPPPRLLDTALSAPPLPPVFAFVRTPFWDRAHPDMRAGLEELADALGPRCIRAELPEPFARADEIRQRVQLAELSRCLRRYEEAADGVSAQMRAAIAAGAAVPARDYVAALDWADGLWRSLEEIFAHCDAILAPAAPGPAPEGLGSTGDPVFNGLWTLARVPAVSLPLLMSAEGLPMGVQLVGRRHDDGRLLRAARWLEAAAAAGFGEG